MIKLEVKSAYERKRYNVMDCYNTVTSETITVTNDTYITSNEILACLKNHVINTKKNLFM